MNTLTPTIIAIDGPAASGKGTLARRLAAHFSYAHLDTGALYRCVGKAVLDKGGDPGDEQAATQAAQSVKNHLNPEDLQDPALRTDAIGHAASSVAKFPGVRQALLDFQKDFATRPPAKGAVLDGRDIGTVICPQADVKLFVTAETEKRAQRRYKELQSRGLGGTYEAVLADMRARDAQDTGRADAPLKAAADALTLDTTELSEEEVFSQALALIAEKHSENN